MNSKKAAAQELLEKKIEAWTGVFKGLIAQVQINPLFDYSDAVEKIYRDNPQDRGAIHQAEILAYQGEVKK